MPYCGRSGRLWRAFTARRRVAAAGAAAMLTAAVLVAPGIAAAASAAPALSFSPAPFNYGQVTVRQPASQTFSLANSGRSATGRLTVTLTGSAAFIITGNTCKSLAPGKTCRVTVRFTPVTSATVTATLTVAGKKHAAHAVDALTGTGKGLGQDLGSIYWADDGDGTINAAGLGSSSSQQLIQSQNMPVGVAVNSTHLYWTSSFDGTISEANLDGSNPQTLVSGQDGPTGLAADGSHIYWSIQFQSATLLGTIWEADLDGGNSHMIVVGQTDPYGVAVSGSHLYWANSGPAASRVGTINEANLDGTNPRVIVPSQADPGVPDQIDPSGVAADGSHLFWTDNAGDAAGAGSVWEANLDGTSPHAIALNQNGPLGVATDGSHVYWANVLDQAIEQANPDGSSAHSIVTGLGDLQLMAVTPPPAALAFTPSPFDYGQVDIGQPVSQTFTLANTGSQATGTLTDTLTGSAAFTITGDTCTGTSLAANGTCTVTVQFAPASRAAFTAALTSASANPAATATVALTATVAPRLLYWINDPGGSESANGTVNQAGLNGTSPHTIVPGQDDPSGIAVGATHIYWPAGGAMNEANLDGTSPRALELTDPNGVNWVAVDASHLYWTSVLGQNDAAIWVAGLDVTGAHTIVTGQGIFMGGLAVDADHIYWTTSTRLLDGDGAVWAAGLDGSNPHIIVPTLDNPLGMAVSGSHVYWASTPGTGGLGAIWEAGLDGSNPHIIVPGQNDPHGVAADASHLYWADLSTINEAGLDSTSPQASS
jgi:hypothetical protein